MFLPERRAETAGTSRKLREDQIFKLVIPDFDDKQHLLAKGAVACTHRPLLGAPPLADGTPVRGGWPFAQQDGDILYGSGGDRIKVVWLRVVGWPDGTVGGPIAIVRPTERFGELFAVGAYRGHADRVSLGTQRMGNDLLVTVEENDCVGRKQGEPCENRLTVLFPRSGELSRVADIPVERVAYQGQAERGAMGRLQYRLTTAATYKEDGIHLVEQIRVSDEDGRELRKAELERLFALDDVKGTLTPNEPPLWDRVVKPEPPPPPAPPQPPRRH